MNTIWNIPRTVDATSAIVDRIQSSVRAGEMFGQTNVVYLASTERRAKRIRTLSHEIFPEGTPERVSRELLKILRPDVTLRDEVLRDFDFFAVLSDTIDTLGDSRNIGRALVNEMINVWRRVAQVFPPNKRTGGDDDWIAALGNRSHVIRNAFRLYRNRLGDVGEQDYDDALWIAADAVRASDLTIELLVVDDLDRLHPARRVFFDALMTKARDVLFVLRDPPSAFVRDAQETLRTIAESSAHVTETPATVAPKFAPLANSWLTEQPTETPAGLEITRAKHRRHEVETCARRVKRLVLDGVDPSEIAVAVPSHNAYARMIDEIFDDAGIPFDTPFQMPLTEVRPVAALLELIQVARSGLDRLELQTALGTPFTNFGDTDERHLSRLETCGRKADIIDAQHPKDWLAELKKLTVTVKGKEKPAFGPKAQTWLTKILATLAPFREPAMTCDKFLNHVETLARECGMQAGAQTALQRNALDVFFRQLLPAMREGFAQSGNPRLSMGELIRALREQCVTREIRKPVPRAKRVQVLGLRELRAITFRHVFVLGLTDVDLPLASADLHFLAPRDIPAIEERLDKARANALCTPIDPSDQADALFTEAILSATETLTLSLPLKDAGKDLGPSVVLSRLWDVLENHTHSTALDDAPVSVGSFVRRVAESASGDVTVDITPELRVGVTGRAIELTREDPTIVAGQYEARLPALPKFQRYAPGCTDDPHIYSASQFDMLSECPTRYFFRYVLGIKSPDEPTLETRANTLGTLVHAVYEEFHIGLRRAFDLPDHPKPPESAEPVGITELTGGRDAALEIMAEAFDRACEAHPTSGPIWQGQLNQVAAGLPGHAGASGMLTRFIDAQIEHEKQGWRMLLTEAQMGTYPGQNSVDEGWDDASVLKTDAGNVRVTGSIDRVDVKPETGELMVFDYKTGEGKRIDEILRGQWFQLPVYLKLLAERLNKTPNGFDYWLSPSQGKNGVEIDKRKNTPKISPDDAQKAVANIPANIAALTVSASKGVFSALTWGDAKPCEWCDYRDACHVRPEVVGERHHDAPDPEAYAPITPEAEDDQ